MCSQFQFEIDLIVNQTVDSTMTYMNSTETNGHIDKNERSDLKSFDEQIEVVNHAVDLFFQNDFRAADDLFTQDPNLDSYIYYKHGRACMGFVLAVVTMEEPEIKEAFERMNAVMTHVKKLRKSHSLSSWIFKTDYNDYTDEEAHAEVIYAEINIASLLLTILCDASFLSLLVAPFKVRAIYKAYQTVVQLQEHKTNWNSDLLRQYFKDGLIGWGFWNILISMLPERVIKILRFVGFSGQKEEGFVICKEVTGRNESWRSRGGQRVLCFFCLFICQIFGSATLDMDWIEFLTNRALKQTPNSAFDLYFEGKLFQYKGKMSEAINSFTRCIASQKQYVSIQSIASWDKLWCHALQRDWRKASECAKFLENNCNWSKATNLYQWACFQYMLMEEENGTELLPPIEEAWRKVPDYRKRYVGRTIPPEKFAITKSMQIVNGKKPHLPAYELFYMWNIFGYTTGREDLINPIMETIDSRIKVLKNDNDENVYIMYLLKGVCLRNYGKHEEAISCFQQILSAESKIREVTYAPPHAAMEIGLSYLTVGKLDEAKSWLHKARDNYTGFLVESLAHLRIHGALTQIRYQR